MATSPEPQLSVVVASLGAARVEETVGSISASAERAGVGVETIVAWQAPGGPPPANAGGRTIAVFPVGLSYARNRGLAEARAPLVAFVDDDELVDPGWVEAAVAAFAADPLAVGVFGAVAPLDDRGLAFCSFHGDEPRVFRGATVAPWVVGTGGNMAFRRRELLAVGGFDLLFGVGSIGRSAEESDVIVRLLRRGHTLAWSPDMVVYHPTKTRAERLRSRAPYGYGMGKLVRRHRDPMLAARYASMGVRSLGTGIRRRDGRRIQEAVATLRGFVEGAALRTPALSPLSALERLPEELAPALAGVEVDPWPLVKRPEPHFLYAVGDELVLHLHVGPHEALRRGLEARESIRTQGGPAGIPVLHRLVDAGEALWVLEERLRGRHPSASEPGAWIGRVAAWAVEMAGVPGRPLAEESWLAERADELVAASPDAVRPALRTALDRVGALRSVRTHGDFQRKNILLDDGHVAVVDWEWARTDGLPGLDLLFLATMARGDAPDPEVVTGLASGRDPDSLPLRALLERVGVGPDDRGAVVLVALSIWAADEVRRQSAPGITSSRPLYRDLFAQVWPALRS